HPSALGFRMTGDIVTSDLACRVRLADHSEAEALRRKPQRVRLNPKRDGNHLVFKILPVSY
ncbi:MAG: hypothetical protein ABSB14_15175, partial [Candidatus Sulfotelmatobacter sp.]